MSLYLLAVLGRNRHAFMFPHAMNVTIGVKEDIQLMWGFHIVDGIHWLDYKRDNEEL
jgi:hypothetical protein